MARSEIKESVKGAISQIKFPLIVKGTPKALVISHNRQSKFTKAQLGKFMVSEKGALDKIGPLNLICP